MKKAIAALLTGSMLVSLCAAPAGAVYQDAQDHWAAAAIETWSGYGVIQGDNGGFRPNDSITRGEMAVILVRLLGLTDTDGTTFADVAPDAWYADAIAKCAAAGILKGDNGMARPNDPISRQEAMVMLGRALGIREEATGNKTYLDGEQVADWAAGYVNALTNGGIVGGVGGNQLAPLAEIDRASVVTILNNAVTNYVNEPGQTVEVSGDGITVVATSNVTLTGETAGDVLIAAGAAHGSVKLDGLKTEGSVIVTGEGTVVTLTGSAEVSGVVVDASAERAQIIVEEDGKADEITVSAPAASVIIKGETASVETTGEADGAQVTVTETGVVDEVNVSSDNTAVVVEGEVSKVTTEADGTDVSGSGKVENVTAEAGASNVTVSTPKTEITVSKDAESGVTVNDKEVKPGETGTTNNKGNNVVIDKNEDSTGKPSGGSSGGSTQPDYAYYTVTFMDGETVVETQRVREGRTVSKPADPVKDGYTFGGWYNGETLYNFDAPVEGSLTLTAKWVANPQTITLVCTDPAVAPKTHVVEYNTVLTRAELDNVVAVDGYHVTSWTLDGVAYDFTTPVTGDMTLAYTLQPNDYTVEFVIEGATVADETLPYGGALNNLPACTEDGFTWTWYTDAEFTEEVPETMPAKDLTLYGQWSHTASGLKGHGTESDPFLIGSAEEFKKIVSGTGDTIYQYELTEDIDFKNSVRSGVHYLENVSINGNGKRLYSSGNNSLYGIVRYAEDNVTISDITYDLTNLDQYDWAKDCVALIYEACGNNILLDSVKVEGKHTVDGNNGAFVANDFIPGKGTLTFRNCEYAANLQGNGYNACFVGWQGDYFKAPEGPIKATAHITFENCVVSGKLVCGKAAIVAANGSNAYARTYEYHENSVTGTVRGTEVANVFTSVAIQSNTENEQEAKDGFGVTDDTNVYVGAEDRVLAISSDENGNLTITKAESSDITSYEVEVGYYTHLYNNGESIGSWLFFVREMVDASNPTVTLKNTGFVDASYCTENNISTTKDELGNEVAEINGVMYYVVRDYIDSTGNQGYVGTPDKAAYQKPSVVRVNAYIGDELYGSAELSKK